MCCTQRHPLVFVCVHICAGEGRRRLVGEGPHSRPSLGTCSQVVRPHPWMEGRHASCPRAPKDGFSVNRKSAERKGG